MATIEQAFEGMLGRLREAEDILAELKRAELPLFWTGSKVGIATAASGAAFTVSGSACIGTNTSGGTGNVNGMLSIGDIGVDWSPTTGNWTDAGTTLLLNALNYSVIGFHDAGSRVDFIRVGGGLITLGYDGGWGSAGIAMPGSASVGNASALTDVRLYVKGQSATSSNYAFYVDNLTPTALLYLRNDGVAWVNQAWTIGSDSRLKDELEPIAQSKAAILGLKPRRYKLKAEQSGKYHHGFTAQEMRETLPDLVVESSLCAVCGAEAEGHAPADGHAFDPLLGIQYEGLIPHLVATIQEQQTEIDELKGELTGLKGELAELKRLILAGNGKPK